MSVGGSVTSWRYKGRSERYWDPHGELTRISSYFRTMRVENLAQKCVFP
jgi:hypothetical protein